MKSPMQRFAMLTALLLCSAVLVCADEKLEPRLVTVSGEAEVKVAPDEVIFDVTVQSLNKDLRTSKTQTDDRVRKVIELTRRYGVAAADVQTDYIKLEPRYRGNDESRLFLGYSVRKDLLFTLKDVTKAEGLLSDLMESGISRINSVQFQTSELRKHRDRARALAIKAAQEKATAFASEIGQKIGKAHSIDEDMPSRSAGANFSQNAIVSFDRDSVDSEGTLALGQIRVSARVTVRFELN